MELNYRKQCFLLRLKVSNTKGRKILQVNELWFSKDGGYLEENKNSTGGIDLYNKKGVLLKISVLDICKESLSLFGFLKKADLLSRYGHWRIPKLMGQDFDTVNFANYTGFLSALSDYKKLNKISSKCPSVI